MPAKIVPTDSQVKQLNLDRLKSIFELPPEYFVGIRTSRYILVENDDSLWNTTYIVTIGKSPKQVTIPANDKPGWFHKTESETVTRYAKVARIKIHPSYSPMRSEIGLTGNDSENKLVAALINKASKDWIFARGKTKDIELEVNVFPESEDNYFDVTD